MPSATIERDLHARVERAERILEDDLGLAGGAGAARAPGRRARRAAEVDRCRALGSDQAQEQARERALAAAALADQRDRLAGRDVEVDLVDGREPAASAGRRGRAPPGSACSARGRWRSGSAHLERSRVVAAELMVVRDRARGRDGRRRTRSIAVGAARREAAGARQLAEARARRRRSPAGACPRRREAGHAAQQPLRVGVPRRRRRSLRDRARSRRFRRRT